MADEEKLRTLSANDKKHIAAALEIYLEQHHESRRQLCQRLEIVTDKKAAEHVLDETFFGTCGMYTTKIPEMLRNLL